MLIRVRLLPGPFKGHTSAVSSIAFSPDGTRIASGSFDRSMHVWSADTGNVVFGPPDCFLGHTGGIRCVVYSPDGKWIATSCEDKIIRVFDAETGDSAMRPVWHDRVIVSIAFSADSRKMASCPGDNTVRIFDIRFIHITD
jgi:WD40 repeat protein